MRTHKQKYQYTAGHLLVGAGCVRVLERLLNTRALARLLLLLLLGDERLLLRRRRVSAYLRTDETHALECTSKASKLRQL
jgi:hypothetical protein